LILHCMIPLLLFSADKQLQFYNTNILEYSEI